MTLSRSRLIVFGLLYVAAMLSGGTLLALTIQALRPTATPVPAAATALPAPPLPTLMATPAPMRSVATPARVTVTAMPTLTATAGLACHVVQWGDTLSRIAWRYHTTVDALKRANGIPGWSELIFPGQCLTIP
jgi:hypothetical protein